MGSFSAWAMRLEAQMRQPLHFLSMYPRPPVVAAQLPMHLPTREACMNLIEQRLSV